MEETIRTLLQEYFQHLDAHNGDEILNDWHLQGVLFINGESRPLAFLQGLPAIVRFEIEQIEHINVSGNAASAVVDWTMNMPGSIGKHVSYFGLVQNESGWRIAAQIDHGMEEQDT